MLSKLTATAPATPTALYRCCDISECATLITISLSVSVKEGNACSWLTVNPQRLQDMFAVYGNTRNLGVYCSGGSPHPRADREKCTCALQHIRNLHMHRYRQVQQPFATLD